MLGVEGGDPDLAVKDIIMTRVRNSGSAGQSVRNEGADCRGGAHELSVPLGTPELAPASESCRLRASSQHRSIDRYEERSHVSRGLDISSCNPVDLVPIHFGTPARNGDGNVRKLDFGLICKMVAQIGFPGRFPHFWAIFPPFPS